MVALFLLLLTTRKPFHIFPPLHIFSVPQFCQMLLISAQTGVVIFNYLTQNASVISNGELPIGCYRFTGETKAGRKCGIVTHVTGASASCDDFSSPRSTRTSWRPYDHPSLHKSCFHHLEKMNSLGAPSMSIRSQTTKAFLIESIMDFYWRKTAQHSKCGHANWLDEKASRRLRRSISVSLENPLMHFEDHSTLLWPTVFHVSDGQAQTAQVIVHLKKINGCSQTMNITLTSGRHHVLMVPLK